MIWTDTSTKKIYRDFPGGPVVKNPPYNAGGGGSIPGRGTRIPHAEGQLSRRVTTREPVCHNYWARALQLLSPRAATRERSPRTTTKSSCAATKSPCATAKTRHSQKWKKGRKKERKKEGKNGRKEEKIYRWQMSTFLKCSISLVLREIQIKITIKCHYIPTIMAKIKKTDHIKYWWECGATGTLIHSFWECKMIQLPWKTVWQILK